MIWINLWFKVTARLKAGDGYHVNLAKLHASSNPSAQVRFYTPTKDYLQLSQTLTLHGTRAKAEFIGINKSASLWDYLWNPTVIIPALFALRGAGADMYLSFPSAVFCVYLTSNQSPRSAEVIKSEITSLTSLEYG